MNRVILAAISSGSGKTTITCGLLNALKSRNLNVKAYKSGPDYIDPMFHERVLGIPSENLDLFFSDADYIKGILYKNSNYDISVIEGAMGIYDGISGKKKEGSVYDLAVKTDTPIILIVNAHGMGNTLISIIKGILLDDQNKLIKGIILNRISENFYKSISIEIENETGIKVLGYIGKIEDVKFDSRHLGLKLPNEIEDIKNQLDKVKDELSNTVSIDAIVEVASNAREIRLENIDTETESASNQEPVGTRLRLAVAKDEAFCFYYEDNFRVIKEAGVDIVFFSPLHDKKIPDNISGILIGGGYPELKASELEANASMKESIKKAIDEGIPSLAECGGFMYLHDYIELEGKNYKMVGAVSGKSFNTGRLVRFGYVDIDIPKSENIENRIYKNNVTSGREEKVDESCLETAGENSREFIYNIKGHEFHYFDSTYNGEDATATKPGNGSQWKFGHAGKGKLWGFPHLYYGSCPEFVNDFVVAMKEYKEL